MFSFRSISMVVKIVEIEQNHLVLRANNKYSDKACIIKDQHVRFSLKMKRNYSRLL